ncbi:hypothetical protein G6F57_000565 [Rhizopus arrhizus]|uniref:AB hydrolase-1 domain-containing protein n=1 Tax=Rhizopus oryzae TaxID=64495 RepID=A0A9P6XKM0_RHIOR|nr:hypothetical protein G6F23_006052 [Rhizopus arrhizus]KAG1422581.1 hypothetical protein G6F58_003217 [Rhizopus delemar]KAG0770585.1 hypothetical protein G6F24_000094 [Rhizopus arrhizus]KAG0797381.1 hypothetical protein G6F21_000582 [Rhizopus arrhizus]KAG0799078.1 hypothetical protein G6F22_003585 [Rhizopus arrhizus]
MNIITVYNLYQYLQKSITIKNSTITALLTQAQQKLGTYQIKKNKQAFSILYPSRSAAAILNADRFFSCPIEVTKDRTQTYKTHVLAETIKKQSHSGPVRPNYVAPREPIVLCHGLFGFDIRGPESIPILQFRYWDGVEDTLAKLGAKVIVTKVPHAGSIWERSLALHNILKSILVGKKVNFVAHSMGGLDCRHLLANNHNRPYHVQSLTTICTPHRGSPVMDWFRDHMGLGSKNYIAWCPVTESSTIPVQKPQSRNQTISTMPTTHKWIKLDKLILDYLDAPAYAHLTTDFCNNYFNPNTPDDPTVKYYSYGASTKFTTWSSLLNIPGKMVYEKEGENDGIVSVKSAQWGTYIKTLEADHWDLSGKSSIPYRFRATKSGNDKHFDRLEFYAELATNLYNQGH